MVLAHRLAFAGLSALALLAVLQLARADDRLGCVNFEPGRAGALVQAAKAVGLTPSSTSPDAKTFSGRVLVWQAKASPATDVGIVRAEWITEYVRRGGSLVLAFSAKPGGGPLKLAGLSPTTAWSTQLGPASRGGPAGTVQAAEWDAELFGTQGQPALAFPYYFKLQPVSAVERGMGRYERFDWTIPYINQHCRPGTAFWTRPLLNRDWRVRIKGDDLNASALLLTGRYGAGRVAVLAGGVDALRTGTGDVSVWVPLLNWLTATIPSLTTATAKLAPEVTVDRAGRALDVTVRNTTEAPLTVTVIARLETWEQAYIGDVEQALTIPAHEAATARLVLPPVSSTSYQALDAQDRYDVRVGVLSESGAELLGERRLPVNVESEVRLVVATDELASRPYPFPTAPGPTTLFFPHRMGLPIGTYSYVPDAEAHAVVTLFNGAGNLAPLAKAEDDTTPNNKSVMALNDEAADAGETPRGIVGYGMWMGQAGTANVLRFTFPMPATLNGVVLNGCRDLIPDTLGHNAGAVRITVDNQEVARADNLDARFKADGRVTLAFPAIVGRVVTITLPWCADPGPDCKRVEPWLAEVEINGRLGAFPGALQGHLKAELKDAMTGETIAVGDQDVALKGGAIETFRLPFKVPGLAGQATRYLTLQSTFQGTESGAVACKSETPLLVIRPAHPLESIQQLRGENGLRLDFIVTRGFRNAAPIGAGTQESSGGWSQPDDEVWAYSRNLKQIGARAKTQASRLYVTDSEISRFANPWTSFLDGEDYFDVATPALVDAVKRSDKWDKSETVTFGFSDRWDSGPAVRGLYDWQELMAFDESLKAKHLPGLQGRTRAEVIQDIANRYQGQFRTWQLDRYSHAVQNMSDAFAREKKRLSIMAQGIPIVPQAYEAMISRTVCGMNDDETWCMAEEDPCLNTGRQMGCLMINPSWRLSTLLAWGYNSAVLNNGWWWSPVGTTEPSRRHYYDRAWRGALDPDGRYHSIHAFGYNANAYCSYTMSQNDWQEWWRLQERHSLLSPDGPFGAGIVLSTSPWADPGRADFSGGGTGGSDLDGVVGGLAQVIRQLHKSGIDLSFASNARALDNWPDDAPLILCNLCECSASEVQALKKRASRGIRMVAFQGDGALTPEAAQIFGVKPDAFPPAAVPMAGRRAAVPPLSFVTNATTMLVAGSITKASEQVFRTLTPVLQHILRLPLEFPSGCAGYGFRMGSQRFIVLEDWREEGRVLSIRYRPRAPVKDVRAVNVNEHQALVVRRDQADWLLDVPSRPGDGTLLCVEEVP